MCRFLNICSVNTTQICVYFNHGLTLFNVMCIILSATLTKESNHRRCSARKSFLRKFAKFTGKHLCQNLFFNKVAGQLATLLKKRLWHSCFPVNFAEFLRTPFLTEHLRWLLLYKKTIIILQRKPNKLLQKKSSLFKIIP